MHRPASKQTSSTWRRRMYLNRDMDGGPFLIYFIHKNFTGHNLEAISPTKLGVWEVASWESIA
jgi:hypothetical protein